MGMYYFHLEDDETIIDTDGTDLVNTAAARQHAARLGEGAVLTGHREDVMELLDATDVLIHPSRFDAFPTTLLEAMAASVPIVATDVGGIPEIVLGGQTGVLVGPPPTGEAFAAAVAPLLDDPGLREALGSQGRQYVVDRYRWPVIEEIWRESIEQVIHSGSAH